MNKIIYYFLGVYMPQTEYYNFVGDVKTYNGNMVVQYRKYMPKQK